MSLIFALFHGNAPADTEIADVLIHPEDFKRISQSTFLIRSGRMPSVLKDALTPISNNVPVTVIRHSVTAWDTSFEDESFEGWVDEAIADDTGPLSVDF